MLSSFPSRKFLGAVLTTALLPTVAFTQNQQPAQPPAQAPPQQQGPTPQPGRDPGGQQQPGRDQMPGRQPFPQDPRQQQRDQFPDLQQQRMFFFSGKVTLDDGTPPPDQVVIERVCNGVARPEGYTDSKGRFSFQLGQNTAMMADASVNMNDPSFGGPGFGPRSMMGQQGISERDLMGCELRASLAGFRSDVVSLAGRRALDNPDVGTIVLHRMAKVDGFTFSATTAYAPKDAKKAFDKGRNESKKKKWASAEKELTKAVTVYPKFAAAWYELGKTYHLQGKAEEAKNAYTQAIAADEKFVNPYGPLARLVAGEKKWEEAADLSAKLIRLNPYYSADVYFISGVANLNLNRLDQAEEHTREAAKMDTQHQNPRINQLLGIILAQKQDFAGAASSIRDYLKYAPNAPDAEQFKQQLAELEKRLAGQQGAVAAQ